MSVEKHELLILYTKAHGPQPEQLHHSREQPADVLQSIKNKSRGVSASQHVSGSKHCIAQGSGDSVPHPLPPHKFSPHDVVDIRPNKADSSGPALVGGLVYRIREDSITIAVEEAPDEGLDQPLRLEKLANEVNAHMHIENALCHGAYIL